MLERYYYFNILLFLCVDMGFLAILGIFNLFTPTYIGMIILISTCLVTVLPMINVILLAHYKMQIDIQQQNLAVMNDLPKIILRT